MNCQDRIIATILFSRPALLNLLFGFLAVLAGCTASPARNLQSQSSQALAVQVFQGAWFEITYPAGFTPAPSIPGSTAEGYDSVEFISPDGRVSFYVYAPQWGGEPTDIALDPRRESIASEERTAQNGREVHWLTICAKDGSYCRAYQDTTAHQGSVRSILGIKYSDEEARRQYLQDYLNFRNSLEQFAD